MNYSVNEAFPPEYHINKLIKLGEKVMVIKTNKVGRVIGINGKGLVKVEFPSNGGCAFILLTYAPPN